MKRLVLVRHAKAVQWGYDDDFNRELTSRGESDAEKVSKFLEEKGILPGLLITSTASRALQTALIFSGTFNYPEEQLIKKEELFHGYSIGGFLDYIRELPDEKEVVFVFGHNPSMAYYAINLCRNFTHEVPTCSSIVIDFPVSTWKEVVARTGSLFIQVNPKALP